jgi:ribosomal protein S18 acetylase RimI-like enzyme
MDFNRKNRNSMKDLIIRNADPNEMEQVALLLKEAYQEYDKFIPSEIFQSYLEDIMDVRSRLPESELIVAEQEGRLVGSVTLYLRRSKSQVWPQGWASVRLLGVLPAYRNRGIGRELMEECIRRCKKEGVHILGLHTTEAMATAKKMYERMGFIRVPEFDFHPRPGVVVMAYRYDIN